MKNPKTWAPGKFDYPGAHVFQNAKMSVFFQIQNYK